MPCLELVTEYLMSWAASRDARKAGGDSADPRLDRLHELVSRKLAGDPVLGWLERDPGPGVDDRRLRRRLQLAMEHAAEEDATFAAALGWMLAELEKTRSRASGRLSA